MQSMAIQLSNTVGTAVHTPPPMLTQNGGRLILAMSFTLRRSKSIIELTAAAWTDCREPRYRYMPNKHDEEHSHVCVCTQDQQTHSGPQVLTGVHVFAHVCTGLHSAALK